MNKKPDYGLDAPKVVFNLAAVLVLIIMVQILLDIFVLKAGTRIYAPVNILLVLSALCFLGTTAAMLLYSYIFKIRHREAVLDRLKISGDEKVLDIGCGRGLYLIGAAKRLTTGKATGIDIWNAEDLSKNMKKNTEENIEAENVSEKVDLLTADARIMPFADGFFDITVSSYAIHNIYSRDERKKALLEIIRVTKDKGRICLIDIAHVGEYRDVLESQGIKEIKVEKAKMLFPPAKVLYAVNSK